jgi:probable HAF family extracellular repeat protein
MKKYWLLLASLAVVLTLTLTGCGGGGGGGGSSDRDKDGIPNNQDAFPDDPTKFASFSQVDLPGLQGMTFSSATAINDSGLIVGTSNDVQGDVHGVFWTGSTATSPTRLEFPAHPGGEFGAAHGINNTGDVVGETNNDSGGRDAIFWLGTAGTPSAASPLVLTPVAGAQFNAAYDINNARRIVGEAQSATGTKAVTWTVAVTGTTATPSQPMMLGEPAGATASSAYAIGEDSRIVGEHTLASGAVNGILWTLSADGTTVASMIPLPPLTGDTESVAYGINADGRIVGESTSAAGVTRGVTWTIAGTVATAAPLGTAAEGNALAINDSGLLVGWTAPTGGTANATVWDDRNLSLFDSVLAATTFSQGFGINATGSIVGMAGNAAFVAVPQ